MGDPIPNNDSDMVELKTIGSTPSSPQSSSSNGNLLHPKAANSPPPLKTTGAGKHARFNIEKVDSPTTTEANTAHNQNTIHDMDTIGYATHEAVPLTMFYRNEASVPGHAKTRPTLEELHKGFDELDEIEAEDGSPPKEKERLIEEGSKVIPRGGSLKFGWFKGVLVPCLLNIWGVILYLRLPLLTGQSGILLITAIILLSACVTTITTLSMSAICTNGEVKGGGAYYLISRALGPEFGGSIGIIFSLANAVGVALYVVGFGETVQQLMQNNGLTMVDKYNDVRIIGVIVVCVLLGVTLIGLDWVIKTQLGLLLILILSMINYVVGCFSGSVLTDLDEQKLQGFTSFSTQTFKDNLFPEFRSGVEGGSFFASFSIFFPAATGILAGVNISGDLKDPGYAIPKGTFTAIVLTTAVYIALAWMIGASTMKDAAGALAPVLAAANGTQNSNNQTVTAVGNTTDSRGLDWCVPNCDYGLLNDVQAMERFSLVGHLVLAGIFAATLSSALASLVGSPKTFQAVCRDGIFKGLGFFGKGSGPNDEPRRAYVLTFLISTGFILIGELNVIAPIISNFFLMSYALINYSVFAASLGRSPGWRPSFKYYNMWLSLLGCFLCIGIMFLINWWAALVTIVIIMTLYKYVDYKKPEINWGSSGQAHTYIKALKLAHSLNRTDEHVKNFRPQCLVLTGAPSSRPNLTLLVSHLTRHVGLMICGQVIVKADGIADTSTVNQEKFLRQKKLKGFVSVTAAPSLRLGAQALMQCSGLGKLRPNIVVIGYKNDWQTDDMEKVNGYINILHDAFEGKLSVALLRTPQKAKGGFLDEEYDDDEYDEELEMNMNSFRNEAAMNPPIVLDYDNENDDEGNTANMEVFESGSEFIIDDNDQDQGCSDSNDVTNDEDVLMDILDEAKELLGPVKKRTWGQRIENSESNWFAAREYLLEELVKREERPSSLCYKCFKAEATIKCVTCSPFLLLCPDCDFDFHQSIIFHDRQWFNGYFKPLKPDEHIKDGEIITIPKPMLLFKDCVSCGHLCDNCEIRTMNAQIAVITTRGRFDLNKYTRICCCCGEHTNPFQIRTLIQNGFWPTTLNYAQTIVNEECFKLWDRFSKRMPGSSLQSFLRSLSDISISNGRNGTINANTFVQVYREYNFAQYEIEKRLSFSWFDCPACGDQQHSCHVDGNCKLYRYKTSGKLVSNSYYGDIFIAKNQHVDDLLEELNYNPKRNSEPVHCGGSILKAAQNVSRKKASLDETGFEYCVCRHGVAQRGVNMYRGEIFGYAYYLQKGIMVDNNVKFMWYDVICKYWAWLESHDPFIKEDMNPALSVLHGKMHQMLCQVKYGGRWQTGAALTSGEEAEQVNSYLSRLTNTTKYMLPQNRDDTITEFAMDWNGRKIRNLAMTLVQRYKKVQKELGKISKPANFDELEQKKQDFILTTQEYAKKGEGDEKEKLMEEIAKIRFEVAMRSAMIGKFAASSKQRTKLRRKNTNDNEKADKLEAKLKEIFGNSDSWKKHLEETERKLEIRKKSKQTIDDGMLYQRHLEEKKLLVEEMKNFTSHYKKKLMSLKTGKSCALASNYTSDIHDKPTLEMQHDTLMEEGEQNLRRKAIDLCSQQLSIGIELFSKVVTNDFSEIPDEENESEFPKSDHETSDTSSDEIDEHNES